MPPQPFVWAFPDNLDDFLNPAILFGGLILLLWFVNIGLTGKLAERKARDDGAWAVAAIFIGPIALIAVALLPRKVKDTTEPPPVPSNDIRGGWGEKVE